MFLEVDDLYQAYEKWRLNLPSRCGKKATRHPELHPSEIATIVCAYHLSGYKCFEYYYRSLILETYGAWFPKAPSYERFVSLIVRVIPLLVLWLAYKTSQSRSSIINHLGQIVSFAFTPGNVADNNLALLHQLLDPLQGKCCGDKGYLTQLFAQFYENGLHLLTRARRGMKPLPALAKDVQLLKQRAVIESVNDILTSICDLEHTRHRSPFNAFANAYAALIAYQFLEHKPHVFIPNAPNYLMAA